MKWTFLAGLGAGTAIGMLIAPKRGAELRTDFRNLRHNTYERGRRKMETARSEARERIGTVMSDVTENVDRATAQAADVGDRVAGQGSNAPPKAGNSRVTNIVNEWP